MGEALAEKVEHTFYQCHDCGIVEDEYLGLPEEWIEISLANFYFEGSEEELKDAIESEATKTVYLRGECGCDHEPLEGNCFMIFEAGTMVYRCSECDAAYDNPGDARGCC